jgi:hypothetical protein
MSHISHYVNRSNTFVYMRLNIALVLLAGVACITAVIKKGTGCMAGPLLF